MTNYVVSLIPSEQCYALWKTVRPLLEPAIETSGGRWKPDYVLVALVTGQHQLWTVTNESAVIAAATSQIVAYPEKKVFCMHFLGGNDWGEWHSDLINTCTQFAKEMNCDGVEVNGRQGFWKWFEKLGWKKASVIYEKSLED